jgi:hypothetical protein
MSCPTRAFGEGAGLGAGGLAGRLVGAHELPDPGVRLRLSLLLPLQRQVELAPAGGEFPHRAERGHRVLAPAAEAALHAVEILDHRLEVEHGEAM